MRRLPLNELTDDMQLARPIYHNNHLLLQQGTKNLQRYVRGLNNLGIFSVYISDSVLLCSTMNVWMVPVIPMD